MFSKVIHTIKALPSIEVPASRQLALSPLTDFIQKKVDRKEAIHLNFICTHNSRRSHLSQVWAQTLAAYFSIPNVTCYSGGTEETALFPKVAETLEKSGFIIDVEPKENNPLYQIRFADNVGAIQAFSKKFDHPSNPSSHFAAIMTCSSADQNCPFIPGAEQRIPITFEDPKQSDGTPQQDEVYFNRSIEIASELYFVFSNISLSS